MFFFYLRRLQTGREQQRTGNHGTVTGDHRETGRVRRIGRRYHHIIAQEPGRKRIGPDPETSQLGRTTK